MSLFFFILSLLFKEKQITLLAMGLGAAVCPLLTWLQLRLFRRVAVVDARSFFRLMITAEILKIILLVLLISLLIGFKVQGFGLVIGFAMGYLTYFFLLF